MYFGGKKKQVRKVYTDRTHMFGIKCISKCKDLECSFQTWIPYTANFFFSFIFISWRLITLQYCSGSCHTLTWISHGFTCVPHPDPPSHLPPHPIPLGLPSAPAPSKLTFNHLSKQRFAPKLEQGRGYTISPEWCYVHGWIMRFFLNNQNYLIFSLLPNLRT